jgi:hypothetical protein
MMSKKQEEIANDASNAKWVEDALTFMSLYEARGVSVPEPRFFDGSIMGWGGCLDELWARYGKNWREQEVKYANKIDNISGGIVCVPESQDGPDAKFILTAARELDYSERASVIPRLNRFGRQPYQLSPLVNRLVSIRTVVVKEDGSAFCKMNDYFYNRFDNWFSCLQDGYHIAFYIGILCSVAFKERWKVEIRLAPNLPSVSFFTDPTGIKETFKFRDVPEGKARRDALLHWVSEHWRRTRDDPEVEAYVREHLRGQDYFTWHDMEVKIRLPEQDIARHEAAISSRKAKRLAQADRRRRAKDRRLSDPDAPSQSPP